MLNSMLKLMVTILGICVSAAFLGGWYYVNHNVLGHHAPDSQFLLIAAIIIAIGLLSSIRSFLLSLLVSLVLSTMFGSVWYLAHDYEYAYASYVLASSIVCAIAMLHGISGILSGNTASTSLLTRVQNGLKTFLEEAGKGLEETEAAGDEEGEDEWSEEDVDDDEEEEAEDDDEESDEEWEEVEAKSDDEESDEEGEDGEDEDLKELGQGVLAYLLETGVLNDRNIVIAVCYYRRSEDQESRGDSKASCGEVIQLFKQQSESKQGSDSKGAKEGEDETGIGKGGNNVVSSTEVEAKDKKHDEGGNDRNDGN